MMDFSKAVSSFQKSTNTVSTTVSMDCRRNRNDSFCSLSLDNESEEEPFCPFNEFILNTSLILESAKLAKNQFKSPQLGHKTVSLDSLEEKQPPALSFPKYLDRLFTEGLFTRKYFHSATLYTLRVLKCAASGRQRISLHKLFAVALYVA